MDKKDFVTTTYYSALEVALSTAYGYLNTTIYWAISLQSALLVFTVSRTTFPDSTSCTVLSLSLILIAHFACRSGKGYLNVVRWSAIQRDILKSRKDGATFDCALIDNYHVKWVSPISFWMCIYKLMFELGYVYLFSITIGLVAYVLVSVHSNYILLIVFVASVSVALFEFVILKKSPYFKVTIIDIDSMRLR